jgi:hypothetical protein
MTGRWLHRILGTAFLTVLGAGVTLAVAGPAAASTKLSGVTVVSDTTAQDTDPRKAIYVECPGTLVVVGTGWTVSGGGRDILIEDLIPTSTTVLAVARVDETGFPGAWSLTVHATCAVEPAGYEIKQDSSAYGSNPNFHTAIALCTDTKETLGVGFAQSDSSGQTVLTDIKPEATRVLATAYEDDTLTNISWSVDAYAICSYPVDGQHYVPDSNQTSWPVTVEMTSCGNGYVPIGVGGYTDSDGNVAIDGLKTFKYQGQDYTSARAREDEDGLAGGWDFTAVAICVGA